MLHCALIASAAFYLIFLLYLQRILLILTLYHGSSFLLPPLQTPKPLSKVKCIIFGDFPKKEEKHQVVTF